MGILCLEPSWVLQSSPLLQPQWADLELRTHITRTTPPEQGSPSFPFQLQEPNGLESLSNHIASSKEGRKLLPEGFPSSLHPPQAAPATGDLVQTHGHGELWMGMKGKGSSPCSQSLPQGAHRHIPSSLYRLAEAFWLPPLDWWKMGLFTPWTTVRTARKRKINKKTP